jgi:exonuclease SbcC
MYVQLDFEQEGSTYRVLRRRSRGKRGQGTLDLFIFREDDSPNSITEPSMRQTQQKIEDLLRLDYETFVHSAFLQQGKADAFTTRTPAERKKILSDILGLDQWAVYEERVKEKLKNISGQLTYFDQRISEIEIELGRKPSLEAELKSAETSHAEAQAALKIAEERLKEVEHAPGDLRNAQDNKADRQRRLREHERELDDVEAKIERETAQISDYQEIIEAREEIESGYAALQSAREANQELSDKLRELSSLKDARNELQNEINKARTRLESDTENLRERIAEHETTLDNDYADDLSAVQAEVTVLQTKDEERDHLESLINVLREERAGLEAAKTAVTAEGQTLRDRLDRLNAADDESAVCPLCGQPLDATHRAELIAEIDAEVKSKREDWQTHHDRIGVIAEEIKGYNASINELDLELKRLQPLIERQGSLQTQVQTIEQVSTRLDEDRAELELIEAKLENDDYAVDLREQLAELDAQQSELGYDETSHDDAKELLESKKQYEELNTRLKIALESLPTLEKSLHEAQARQDRLQKAYGETEAEIAAFDSTIIELTALVEEYNARNSEVMAQRTQERSAYERVVSAKQSLDALDAQETRKAELEERRDNSRHQEAIYNELKRAFGKNGIPAMVIETAIPDLETTANRLLSRMTDGRMHLSLNTQREKVTGGIAETLDIEIADELGTRSYEMYSGGEAFRINFAIRVALSQMLARRAGAHLRTLFIDEGFGTQDEDGRSKLVEAINTIQEEFSLILVITHIDELRDSFPVHIVVEKTSSGSRVQVV